MLVDKAINCRFLCEDLWFFVYVHLRPLSRRESCVSTHRKSIYAVHSVEFDKIDVVIPFNACTITKLTAIGGDRSLHSKNTLILISGKCGGRPRRAARSAFAE